MSAQGVIDLLSAALAPVTAVVATWVAVRQYQVQRIQARLQMYERRLTLYRAYQRLLLDVATATPVHGPELLQDLTDLSEAPFLLRRSDAAAMNELRMKVVRLAEIRSFLNGSEPARGSSQPRDELNREADGIRSWARQQYETAEERFAQYLASVH
jgi:hypothetical protein